ncbi:MAG: formylglycine-generating enzyme family protein [Candidatus Onthomorpha sp.]
MVANETYKVSVDNCFEHVEQVINPSKYEEGNNVPLSFEMHKAFGKITVEVEGHVLYEGDSKLLITVNGVSFEMVYVEGGTFSMGATSEQGSDAMVDEKPVHSVTLSDYYIGETEVTQELWEAVMGSNPSYFKGNNQRPVEKVSWNDCQKFIRKLNSLTGKSFRLPTEAEWEYAARGGKYCKYYVYKYSGSNNPDEVAWYDSNSGKTTNPVKTKKANKLGLYDMSGNVWEWCNDKYGSNYYKNSPQTNPTGPSKGEGRVLRGGSWSCYDRGVRVSYRSLSTPDYRDDNGLRLAL